MGWLDDITDIPWQQVFEKIQNTMKTWQDSMPKLGGDKEMMGKASAQEPPPPFMYDYAPYIVDPEAVNAKFPNGIPQIEGETSDLIRQYMPNDATAAAIAILSESGNNPRAQGTNNDGSIDRGLGQINSNTFADYQSRMPNTMADMGIGAYQDMFDPSKNIQMMDLIKKYQGWGAWYGPRKAGFDLNK